MIGDDSRLVLLGTSIAENGGEAWIFDCAWGRLKDDRLRFYNDVGGFIEVWEQFKELRLEDGFRPFTSVHRVALASVNRAIEEVRVRAEQHEIELPASLLLHQF